MQLQRLVFSLLFCGFTAAAEAATDVAVVTLADPGTRVLRGVTWYRLVPGATLDDGDILAAEARAHVQMETPGGTIASVAGEALALVGSAKDGALTLDVRSGWLKVAAKAPGALVRTTQFDVALGEAIVVMRVLTDASEMFLEAGNAKIAEASGPAREAKRGEYLRKFTGTPIAASPGAPKAFVDGLPRIFIDPLPMLAGRLKSKPTLVADHDVTYAEAEPWLDGRDRIAFEKRFVSRLKDPAFRKAADANIARHPAWDRILHPEKYQPKKQ
jgi:hypothetical protein